MEGTITDILRSRCSNFSPSKLKSIYHDFNLLGLVDSFPDINKYIGKKVFIWYIEDDITILENSEIERWSIDAEKGNHILLSERDHKISLEKFQSNDINFTIWGPEELALWIGKAVISKDIITLPSGIKNNQNKKDISIRPNNEINQITLKPKIDITSWLETNSWSNVRTTPILLCAKLWNIKGELVNEQGEIEVNEWDIVEDPWSNELYHFKSEKELNLTPSLRIINPMKNSWKSNVELLEQLGLIVNEKRQGKPKIAGRMTRTMMLQNWQFNKENSLLSFQEIYVPGWILNSGEELLLHGINGKTFPIIY
ncbi:MAG: hypothetical protein ACKVI6_05340 [Candidatus Poseidoniales archaeon]